MELYGNAQITKTEFATGDGSLMVDGAADSYYGDNTKSVIYGLADKDYTIEMWFKWNDGATAWPEMIIWDDTDLDGNQDSNEPDYLNPQWKDYVFLMDFRTKESDTAWVLVINPDKQLAIYDNISIFADPTTLVRSNTFSPILAGGTINDTNWHRVVISRRGNKTALWLDGSQAASIDIEPKYFLGEQKTIRIGSGHLTDYSSGLDGYIDDVVITNGLSLYDPDQIAIDIPTALSTSTDETALLAIFPGLASTPQVSTGSSFDVTDTASIIAGLVTAAEVLDLVDVCGENGVVDQIKNIQTTLNQLTALGKNSISALQSKINEVKTLADSIKSGSKVPIGTLQQDLLNILSKESLANPQGAAAKLLALGDKYQDASAAMERVIANVSQFINDPLNTPLDICNDIPNLQLFDDGIKTVANNSLVPDPSLFPENLLTEALNEFEELLTITAGLSEEALQTVEEQFRPTLSKFALADIGSDRTIGGHLAAVDAYFPKPGQAHLAATNVALGRISSILDGTRSGIAPLKTIANPFPDVKQYVAADFYPSKYRRNIAQKVNTLHPGVRSFFARGVQNYLSLNFEKGRDINVIEGYRSPNGSPDYSKSEVPTLYGTSWHNFGAAVDIAIYVNGKWDDGNRSAVEYVTFARDAFAPWGIVNDLLGEISHFYIEAFGKTVPMNLRLGAITIWDLLRLNVVFDPEYIQGGGTGIYDPSFDPNFNPENDYFPPGYDPINDPRSPVYNPPVDDQPEQDPIDIGDPFDVRLIAIDAAGGETITEPTTPENPNPPPPPPYYVPSSGTIIGTGGGGGGSGYGNTTIVVPGPIYPPAEPSVIQPIFRTNGTEHELFGRNFDLDPNTDVSTLVVSATGYDRTSILGDVSAEPAPFGLDPTSFEYPGTTTLRVTRDGKVYVFSSTE